MRIAYRILPGHAILPELAGYIAVVDPADPSCLIALFHPDTAKGFRHVFGDSAHLSEVVRDQAFTSLHAQAAGE